MFAKEYIDLEPLNWSDTYQGHKVKHFLPAMVNKSTQILGVWTHQNNSPNFGYIGQFWKYLRINKEKFSEIIIAGDFNSNKIWDEWDRWWNHSDVVNELLEIGVQSLYHQVYEEGHGQESRPTFCHRSNKKSYHIDYIFASRSIFGSLGKFEVGDAKSWLKISDHVPLVANFSSEQVELGTG